jgi:site-specific DNA-methyltransferase (adenine-specific)
MGAMTPYYESNGITIYCADCRDVLPTLAPGSVDLVLTDPPYNAGISYIGHDDNMDPDDYAAWCREWFVECDRLAKRIIVFPGHGNLPVWWSVKKPHNVACWYKPGNPAGGGVIQFCEWEPWLYWGPFIGGSNVIRATVTKQRETGEHPCPKPLSLFKTLIEKTKATTVLDPFLGSGTTTAAAHHLGVRAIGIEKSERYCEIAVRRLQQQVLPLIA